MFDYKDYLEIFFWEQKKERVVQHHVMFVRGIKNMALKSLELYHDSWTTKYILEGEIIKFKVIKQRKRGGRPINNE